MEESPLHQKSDPQKRFYKRISKGICSTFLCQGVIAGKRVGKSFVVQKFEETKEQEPKKNSQKGSGSIKKLRKKRAPLSVAATRNMKVNNNPITLNFD